MVLISRDACKFLMRKCTDKSLFLIEKSLNVGSDCYSGSHSLRKEITLSKC